MKRTVITLVGLSVLMFFTFVSCEDKLLDDNKGSEEDTEVSPYRTLQDSMFYYRDGKLQSANYYYYDSIGRYIKTLGLGYDNEGNLIMNQEVTFFSEGNKNITYYNNNGLKDDIKYVRERSGSGVNYIETYKYYAYHEGIWILINEGHSQRDNNSQISNTVQYALYNGEMIVVKRSKTKQTYNSVSGTQSSYEREEYNKYCYYSNSDDPFRISANEFGIIRSIEQETWNKSTTRYDERGNTVENIRLTSNDSITWNESKSKSDYRYDSFGNMIEAINKENDIYTNKHTWSFDNKNRLLKEVYSVWSESERDFVVDHSIEYRYSSAGILAAAELYSKSSNIRLPQMKTTVIVNEESVRSIFSISYGLGGGFGGMSNNAEAKCSITCDSNGNPASEVLYRLDSEGNLEEVGRCSLVYDSNGTNYSYVVEMLENGDWIETEKSQRTASFDANGNLLNSYSYLYSKSTNNYGFYSFSSVQENESRTENRYNELGYISYSSSSSISNTCYVYSDGREEKRSSESKQETYYTTIKVK